MRVSIVTLSFNQGEFLEPALSSVLQQDHPDIEYIVVDPGSTDGSRDILRRHADRLARIILEPDRGPADGLNKGLQAATGEIFGYLNADDRLLPGAVSEVAAAFARFPDADVVYGDGYVDDRIRGRVHRLRVSRPPFPRWLFAHGGVEILQQSMFFRRGAVARVGGFNSDNRTCWDGELVAELLRAGAVFRHIPRPLAVFTIHAQSISGANREIDRYQADWRRIVHRLTGRGPASADAVLRLAARCLRWTADPLAAYERLGRHFGRSDMLPP